jgi:chemotaxis protein CheX
MLLTDVDLAEVVESVWTAMLGYELEPTDEPNAQTADGRHMVGTVQITGRVDAALMVEVPEALARNLASTMFGIDETELGDDEVRDALGEMANMIGGNVKGLLDADSLLSLPTVAEGHDYRVVVPGGGVVNSLNYRCAGTSMRVQLIGRTA